MTITTEQAVALAKQAGMDTIGSGPDWFCKTKGYAASQEELLRFVALVEKQVIKKLAQQSGVMPEVVQTGFGREFFPADEVREAIATMQARVVELEKDAARYRWLREAAGNRPSHSPTATLLDGRGWFVGYELYGDKFKPLITYRKDDLDEVIDAAMNKESGK